MKVFTYFLFSILFISFSVYSNGQWPQGGSLSGIPAGSVGSTFKTNWGTPTCTGTAKNLETANTAPDTPTPAPISGSMNNDTWFSFQAKSTKIKVRVCNPTFDAAVEVWRIDNQTRVAAFNANGDGGLEVGLATGLVYNGMYAVRVGRSSGSGAGSFILTIEHFTAQLATNYTPSPPGLSCYNPSVTIQRTIPTTTPSNIATNTRWIFYTSPEDDSVTTCTNPFPLLLSSCYAFCLGQDYKAYCEMYANDPEVGGNIWWGTSEPKFMDFCNTVCPGIISPSNNASLSNIRSASFQSGNLGNGSSVQWKFVTDNGATELCSPWVSTAYFVAPPEFANCLEFNKFYSVYVRGRYCPTDPEPNWCGPVNVFSQPMPRGFFPPSDCCKWRNKISTLSVQVIGFPMHQYRFRFTPVANMSNQVPANNLAPIGPAVVTGWVNISQISTNLSAIQPGTIYNVQVQGRLLSANCVKCNGTSTTLPERYVDWGPPCLMGFRTPTGPAAGSSLTAGCNIGAMMLDDWNEEEYAAMIAEFGTIVVDDSELEIDDELVAVFESEEVGLNIYSIAPGILQMDLSAMQGQANVKIYEINGRLIFEKSVFQPADNNAAMVVLDKQIPSGIYVVSIIGQDSVITKKIFISGN